MTINPDNAVQPLKECKVLITCRISDESNKILESTISDYKAKGQKLTKTALAYLAIMELVNSLKNKGKNNV